MMKILLLKSLFSFGIKTIAKGIVIAKKGIEKDYVYFKWFRKFNLQSKIKDKSLSIYLETIFQYERERGEDKAKLFYLNDAFESFDSFYNEGKEWAFKAKIDEVLHTSRKLLALKNEVINPQDEINYFIKIYKSAEKKVASQSNNNLLKGQEEIKTSLSDIKDLLQQNDAEKPPLDVKFNLHLVSPEKQIPRSIISLEDHNNRRPFIESKKTSLQSICLKHQRVVLLANGGMGKTIELQTLVFTAQNDFFPIYVTFKSYTNQSIENYLPDKWNLVPKDKLLLVLDGLDEVRNEDFITAIRKLNAFIEKNPKIRIVLSCRTNHLDSSLDQLRSSFEIYYLETVNIHSKEVQEYIKIHFNIDFEKFVNLVFEYGYIDLTDNPFYLNKMLEIFQKEGTLQRNRGVMFEHFVDANSEFDKEKYNLTIDDIKYKQLQLLKKLEYIAIGMETYGKNEITVEDLSGIIDLEKDIELIKYTKSFKKSEQNGVEKWQFDHRLIQEFLAAKALSKLTFEQILVFITFTSNNKIIPSWANTLTFLFSIIEDSEKLDKLTEWIIENDKDALIKVEREKVSEQIRTKLFKEFFNYYKCNDVRIFNNKYSDKELVNFGQSIDSIQFIIDELKDEQNTQTVHINAIGLIGYFELNDKFKNEIENILFEHINNNIENSNYIFNTIHALKRAKIFSKDVVDKLMTLFKDNKNQYVRAAMYSIILESGLVNDYVDYIVAGYKLIKRFISTGSERGDTSLLDEELNLKRCAKEINSPESLKQFIDFVSNTSRYDSSYDSENVLKVVVENSIRAYNKDSSVYHAMLSWFVKDVRGYRTDYVDDILTFFNKTETREKAFYEIWEFNDDELERNKSLAIARLLTSDLINFVIEEYQKEKITEEELQRIYFDLSWVNNQIRDEFDKLVVEKTDYEIKKPDQIDYEGIRKKKAQEDFNLLFDNKAFKDETLKVFDSQNKDELTFDELFEIRKQNLRYVEMEDFYSSYALWLLRDFVNQGQTLKKEKVVNWFLKEGYEEWYRITMIYNNLSSGNEKKIEITSQQELYIVEWCKKNVQKVDFKNSITVHGDGRTTFKNMALYIWYFSRRFNIDYDKMVLLDMLSFDFLQDDGWSGIDYLIKKLNPDDISNRLIVNMSNGIDDENVLKNHIKYLSEHKIKESYPLILQEIKNLNKSDYRRKEYLDIFFEFTNDIDSLKNILGDPVDSAIKWRIIEKLKVSSEEAFIEDYLLKEIKKVNEKEEKGKAAEILVTMQNIEGLKTYVEWIKNNTEIEIGTNRAMCLNSLRKKETIPYLIELLELSYIKEIKFDHFERFNSQVLGAFYNVALVSEENLNAVKESLNKFINEKRELHNDVKYILHTIERIEQQFYMNQAQSYTITEVKEKLIVIK